MYSTLTLIHSYILINVIFNLYAIGPSLCCWWGWCGSFLHRDPPIIVCSSWLLSASFLYKSKRAWYKPYNTEIHWPSFPSIRFWQLLKVANILIHFDNIITTLMPKWIRAAGLYNDCSKMGCWFFIGVISTTGDSSECLNSSRYDGSWKYRTVVLGLWVT